MTVRALTMLNETGDSKLTWAPDRQIGRGAPAVWASASAAFTA